MQTGGIEDYAYPEFRERLIVPTNAKIIPAMGDHAMALLLGLTREIWRGVEARTTEEWSDGHWKPVERLERVEALPDLLPLADVVFVAAPLTDRTAYLR